DEVAPKYRIPDCGKRVGMGNILHIGVTLHASIASALLVALTCSGALAGDVLIDAAGLPRIGTVDERFQSYNVEMVEVTGGRFWKPYEDSPAAGTDLYAYR